MRCEVFVLSNTIGRHVSGMRQEGVQFWYLEKLVYENTCFIHHGDIQWTPVLEKGEIEELVVDCEVIIRRYVVR